MNLNMIQPENEAQYLLLSITGNCETLIEQTNRKAEETLECKLTTSRETFYFKPPISVEESWLIGLKSLELFNSIFNITEENNNFEIYEVPDSKIGGISYEKVRDRNEKVLGNTDIADTNLKHDIISPINIE